MAWLFAVLGYCRLRRPGSGESEQPGPGGETAILLVRTRVVAGSAADVLDGLARVFEAAGRSGAGPALVVKREGDGCLIVTNLGRPGLASGPSFSRCRVEVRSAEPAGAEVTLSADTTALRRRALRLAVILLGVGLAVLAGAGLLCWQVTAPGARVTGLAQPVLFALFLSLPAPWAVYALYRRAGRSTEMFLDSAVANAAALAGAFAAKRAKAARE